MKHFLSICLLTVAILFIDSITCAQTSVDSVDKFSYSANSGWIDWQGDVNSGARFTSEIGMGFIYSANIGWINLGDGLPDDGVRYSNTSATDFGVNVEFRESLNSYILTGYAYSANVGWIVFDLEAQAGVTNQPRIDKSTGVFLGNAWGANIGWLPLFSSGFSKVQTAVLTNASASNWMLY